MQDAVILEADLRGANLDGADLYGTDLSYTTMQGAILCNTRMPDATKVYSGC